MINLKLLKNEREDMMWCEKSNIIIAVLSIIIFITTIFLIDSLGFIIFFMACFPVICLVVSIFLIGISIYNLWKMPQKGFYKKVFILGIIILLFPIVISVFITFSFLFGGPVPS